MPLQSTIISSTNLYRPSPCVPQYMGLLFFAEEEAGGIMIVSTGEQSGSKNPNIAPGTLGHCHFNSPDAHSIVIQSPDA